MTAERFSATVRRATLLPAVLIVGAWAMPTAPAAASRLQPRHAAPGAGQRLSLSHAQQGLNLAQLPANLAATIRQTVARQQPSDYRIQAQGTRYLAASPRQHMQTVFTAAGPRLSGRGWTWGMRLVGLGRSRIEPVARGTMVSQGSGLAYRRGSLTEWYRNRPTGLEQGFTLGARPADPGGGAITLELGLSGSLQAHLERGGAALGLSLPSGQRVLRYGGLAVHDARGRSLEAHLELTGQRLRLVVQDRGARYPITIDPYTYQTQLDLGTGAASGDYLGVSAALSSDGNTALLGAYGRRVNGQFAAGAGEVFTRSGTTWTYQTQLDLGTSAALEDNLGSSVALSSDGTIALLGASGRTVNGEGSAGAGEIFTRRGATWTYQTQLDLGMNAAPYDNLGVSAALSSDGTTALLGASGRTLNGQRNAGAGEIFTRSGTTWSHQSQLDLATNAAPYDNLGFSAALSSDGNIALLGVPDRSVNGQSAAGAGEVFTRGRATWTHQAQLDLGINAAHDDYLGYSVALSSDGTTALLGAERRTVNGEGSAGAGEVFTRSGTTWTYQTQLDLGTSASGADQLGTSVALSSNGSIALLGAYGRTVNGQSAAGAGEVFTRSGTSWTYQTQLDRGAGAVTSDLLGSSAALSSDGTTALLGAVHGVVNGQIGAGAGEIFIRSGATWTYQAQLDLVSSAASSDELGQSVALSSDGNTALLGAFGRDDGAGEVFIRSGATWSYQAQLDTGTTFAIGDTVGVSVALSSDGNTALLGLYGRTVNGLSYAGKGAVFTRTGTSWTRQAQLDLGAGAAANDYLGYSVALSGDGNTALLGAYGRTVNRQSNAGAGEVFTRSMGTWTFQAQLDLGANAATNDYLGYSVALSSDETTALLGAFGRTVNGKTHAGAGEIFTRSGTTWTYQTQLDLGANAASGDDLGVSVSLSSDGTVALLGANLRTVNGQTNAGAGEVFTRSGTTWTYQTQLDLGAGATANTLLGASVALSSDGTTALLGADRRIVNGKTNAGAGEIYTRSGTTWTYQTQLDLGAGAAANDYLGFSAALSSNGTTALLGAFGRKVNGQSYAGAGEVFNFDGRTIARVLRFSVHRPAGSLTTRQRTGLPLQFRWRMATQAGVAGFTLYAGRHQLNAQLIPVHRSTTYRYTLTAHLPPLRQGASFSLHVLLTNGSVLIVSVGTDPRLAHDS